MDVGPPLWSRLNISKTIGRIALKFWTDIHASQMMDPTEFSSCGFEWYVSTAIWWIVWYMSLWSSCNFSSSAILWLINRKTTLTKSCVSSCDPWVTVWTQPEARGRPDRTIASPCTSLHMEQCHAKTWSGLWKESGIREDDVMGAQWWQVRTRRINGRMQRDLRVEIWLNLRWHVFIAGWMNSGTDEWNDGWRKCGINCNLLSTPGWLSWL